jgi:hypothetical protein
MANTKIIHQIFIRDDDDILHEKSILLNCEKFMSTHEKVSFITRAKCFTDTNNSSSEYILMKMR